VTEPPDLTVLCPYCGRNVPARGDKQRSRLEDKTRAPSRSWDGDPQSSAALVGRMRCGVGEVEGLRPGGEGKQNEKTPELEPVKG